MKHIVFCGAAGTGKSTQAHRLMNILSDEWAIAEDTGEDVKIIEKYALYDILLIEKCQGPERIAWLAGTIDSHAKMTDRKLSAVFTTQDVEGAAQLDRNIFRVLECIASKTRKGVYQVKALRYAG